MNETTYPLFDPILAGEAAIKGIAQAEVNKHWLLDQARDIAIELGQQKRFVTADDVVRVLSRRYPRESLGNAAGGIFKGPAWRWDGESVRKSERVSSHGRLLRIWEYIGK